MIVLLIGSFVGCEKCTSTKTVPVRVKVRAATVKSPDSGIFHIAVAKGYLDSLGIEIVAEQHTFGKTALATMIGGKADIAFAAETPITISILNGSKVLIASTIFSTDRSNAIVVRKDHGIKNAKDLKGKKIGFAPGTSGDFFMDSYLASNGVSRNDVTTVPLNPEEWLQNIDSGKIDAVSAWIPYLPKLKDKLGNMGLAFYDRQIYTQTFNLVVNESYSRSHPEVIEKIVAAFVLAEKFILTNPDEARAIIAAASDVTPESLMETWNDSPYRVSFEKQLLISMEDEARWAERTGITKDKSAAINLINFLYLDALIRVRPESVKLSR